MSKCNFSKIKCIFSTNNREKEKLFSRGGIVSMFAFLPKSERKKAGAPLSVVDLGTHKR
jgi:hypothetical protein